MLDSRTRTRALEGYERVTELPLLALALAMVPLIILPLALDLDPTVHTALLTTDWIIWAVFAMDLGVRTYLSEKRLHYLSSHWYDVLIVAIPFLRPLRVVRSARAVRLLRLTRAGSFAARFLAEMRELARRNGLGYVLGGAVLVLFAAAGLVFVVERGDGGPINDFGTALWWTISTVTTVGYGDVYPVTPEGRGIAAFVMVLGISLFGFLTASIAAFLVEQSEGPDKSTLEDVMQKLDLLEAEMQQLRREMGR